MFSKADKTKAPSAAVRAAPSLISTDLEVTGNIMTTGEVQLDGAVKGDIVCGKLVIGEKAIVTGQIETDEVIIRGRITGRVRSGSVHLAKSAQVVGDIWHDTLTVEAGAFLEGLCKRNETDRAGATASRAKGATAPLSTASATAVAAVPAASQKAETSASGNPNAAAARQSPVQDGTGKTAAKAAAVS